MESEDVPTCLKYGEEEETSYHFLGRCEAYDRQVQKKLSFFDWANNIKFLIVSGRFTGSEMEVVMCSSRTKYSKEEFFTVN